MRCALVFPGQGSQRPGMLGSIPEVDGLDRLLDAAEALTGQPLRDLAASGSPSDLKDTLIAQPLLYLADWAWGSSVLEVGVAPDVLAGHSLGELAALAIAGVYSPEAGLELVCERARLMSTVAAETPGTMAAALGVDSDVVDSAIQDVEEVWIANDNAPGQVVISGSHDGVEEAGRRLLEAGAKRVVALDVAGPFHSPLMEPAAAKFSDLLDRAEMSDARIPVVQNTRPTPSTAAEEIRAALSSQITAPVRWTETMQTLAAHRPVTVVEAGPGTVLRGLARRVDGLVAVSVEEIGLEALVEEVLR